MLGLVAVIALLLLFLGTMTVFFADEITDCLHAKAEELRARAEALRKALHDTD